MKTLFPSQVNWGAFLLVAFFIRISLFDVSFFSYLAVILSLYQFTLLFTGLGNILPVRYLFGAFMCLQFCIGPVLAYNGLDQYQFIDYRMQIPEAEYFSYALPAVICFILGLHITAGNFKGEILDEDGIRLFVDKNPQLPYIFIIAGFLASVVAGFFPANTAFLFYLLGDLKFFGLFLLILGGPKLKTIPLILVFGSILGPALQQGLFHDLLTWLIFVGAIYAIKYKFGFNIKLIGCVSFILLAVVIQQLKGVYRTAIGHGEEADLETVSETYEARNAGDNSIFSFASLAPNNVRINQGFIITNIIKTVPDRVPFANGDEMLDILEAAFLPRVIDPDKLTAGAKDVFIKYSGIRLNKNTSMGLSSLGDAYINFGYEGGCVFMFFLGLLYSTVLNFFDKQKIKHPAILLFLPMMFYYPIRPDCELQTILGHLVKSTLLVLVIVYYWKSVFVDMSVLRKKKPSLTHA
jgi:hypothetical protein